MTSDELKIMLSELKGYNGIIYDRLTTLKEIRIIDVDHEIYNAIHNIEASSELIAEWIRNVTNKVFKLKELEDVSSFPSCLLPSLKPKELKDLQKQAREARMIADMILSYQYPGEEP